MRIHARQFDSQADDVESFTKNDDAKNRQHARGRSSRSPRRRTSKSARSTVPLGIAARRNHRWSW